MSLAMKIGRAEMLVPAARLGRLKAQTMRTMEQVGPLAESARVVAAHRIEDARMWAAPRLDRAAQSVEEDIAPKVSAFLSQAAKRIDPSPAVKARRRWPVMVLVSGLGLGALGYMLYRNNARQWTETMKDTSADKSRRVGEKADEVRGRAEEVRGQADETADRIAGGDGGTPR